MQGPAWNVQKRRLGLRRSPAQTSPALPSPTPSTSTCPRRAAKARGKSPRSMTHERGWYGWYGGGCGGHVVRHCRPSIGRALLHTGDHIRGCTGPKIRRLYRAHCKGISIQSMFISKRTSWLPAVTHTSCHGSAGSRALAWALCIASDHAAQPKDTSTISLQPLGRTPALQVTDLHHSCSPTAGPQMGHSF